ncbi:unnamed protein product, partial [Medioppia subpectinata]
CSYEDVNSVPDYITQVIPYFVSLIFIEQIIAFVNGFRVIQVSDAIASLSQGIAMELSKSLFKGLAIMSYIYIYQNWRICSLEWQNTSTWIIAFIAVDFGFYWIHRFTHEINVLWAAHQVHHSSQQYNLTTALRQSYILNTPSHHRVHHGRNEYCIDKNYGGVLIIWDRLFGTFQMETDCVSYGLTKNIHTFNPFTIQMHHYFNIYHKFNHAQGFTNKWNTLFAGPAWEGATADGPKHEQQTSESPDIEYDPQIP